jgi:hypothetical protein
MRFYHVSAIALTLVGLAVLLPPEPEVPSVAASESRVVNPRGVSAVYLNRHMVDRLAAGGPLAIRWYAVDGVEKPSEEDSALDVPANWCGNAQMRQPSVLVRLLVSGLRARVKRIGERFAD